jgi:UDP-glucose 4-epimerase
MKTLSILVTGGAGYIGSHMVKLLAQQGYQVVTIDDLSAGFEDAILVGDFVHGSLHDTAGLDALFSAQAFDAVIHFAGSIAVGESVTNPAKYYRNNVVASLNLFDVMLKYKVDKLVFSSTAAVFGLPEYIPIDELHRKSPINPYGVSKWMIEKVLLDYERAYGMRSVALRYFNASGADPDGVLGERHDPETHLIPLALRAAKGEMPELTVFGTDYDTPDGTCVRDYVHVSDICDAHLLALNHLVSGGESRAYNLGNGQGYSVREVIDAVERVSGRKVKVRYGARRDGDPPRLVANSSNICRDLEWEPKYKELDVIVSHAWNWELMH